MLDMPENNVYLSKEELNVAIPAIANALRIPGLSDSTIHLLEGVHMELRWAFRRINE